MQLSIKFKLFLVILAALSVLILTTYTVNRYNFNKGFLEYRNRIEERYVPALLSGLSDFYEQTGSWETLRGNPDKWLDLIRESIERSADPEIRIARQGERYSPATFSPNDWYYSSEYSPARPYLFLLDSERNIIFGTRGALEEATIHPIVARGKEVGFLGVTSQQELSDQADLLFSEQQQQSLQQVALFLVLISALIAFPTASYLVRPVHDIVSGTRALISGDYSSRIKVKGSDELSQLANDFNMLAKTLEQNREVRQQWIADISHELRTPLAVLRGELESIQDGVRPVTQESLDSLHTEVVHLSSLVNDLHELSMSDLGALIYEKNQINISEVLDQNIDIYRPLLEKNGIKLTKRVMSNSVAEEIMMLGDEKRLSQLFSNLLQNTCRYTDPGGNLVINLLEADGYIKIDWYDSAPGVSDDDLERLFDRLYRVGSARNRANGGSGLGLAICKNIVEAHEGTISASHSELGGLKISISFPRKANKVG